MSVPARRIVSAGNELARERLAAYARYAELVAQQERALEREDLEAFRSLAASIEELQAEIGQDGGVLHDLGDDTELGAESFVGRVSEIVRSTLARNERIQARLGMLRRRVGASGHRAPVPLEPAARYAGTSAGDSPADAGPHLDVTF